MATIYSKEERKQFLQILENQAYNITAACRAFNIDRKTFYNWLQDPDFNSDYENLREQFIDNVESAIYKEALGGNVTAQIFILKTIGKKRGYVETVLIGDAHLFEGMDKKQYEKSLFISGGQKAS